MLLPVDIQEEQVDEQAVEYVEELMRRPMPPSQNIWLPRLPTPGD